MPSPLITLLSDFGAGSGYPAQMKGVILGICPEARLVDLSHEVPPFQILVGQALLRDAVGAFPPGTIHLAVVDPGVGSSRKPLLVVGGQRAPGQFFVGPDNGLLWPFMRGGRVFELASRELRRPDVSATFHGRDIFAPAAAHLACGVEPEKFGPEVLEPVKLQPPRVRHEGGTVVGEVLHVDHFGNLVSNLDIEDLPPLEWSALKVSVGGRTLKGIKASYSQVAPGELVAVVGSSGLLEIAVREGSAARELGLDQPHEMPVVVEPI
jgi:S-adenosylmethionine hydrolase